MTAVLVACQQQASAPAPTSAPAAKPTTAPAAAPTTAPGCAGRCCEADHGTGRAGRCDQAHRSRQAAATDEGTPKKGGTLRYGLSTDPSNFEPHVSTGAASGGVKLMVYNTLLTYDRDGKLIGDLVDSFGWADNQTYELKLKQGVLFHDGFHADAGRRHLYLQPDHGQGDGGHQCVAPRRCR